MNAYWWKVFCLHFYQNYFWNAWYIITAESGIFCGDRQICEDVRMILQHFNDSFAEAEYAFQLKKDIIPLMLEPQYQPDGWLGIVVGAKFWLDFSTKSKVGENANKLLKEIGDRGRVGNETIVKAIDELDLGGGGVILPNFAICNPVFSQYMGSFT